MRNLLRRLRGGSGLAGPLPLPPEPAETGANDPVAALWDRSIEHYIPDGFKVYWETLDLAGAYQAELITGTPGCDPVAWILAQVTESRGSRGLRALSLGCQEEGAPEMAFMRTGCFESIDVMDIAAGLLERQHARADAEGLRGISYIRRDLNEPSLPESTYDLVWSVGTVHHLARLEHLFDVVGRALRPGGLFVLREYVGPDRLQYPEEHLALVNDVLSCLPERFRRRRDGSVKDRERPPLLADLIRDDPSEAVRSSEIVALLRRGFDVERFAWTGGALLSTLLNEIAGNFEREADGPYFLRLLITLDRLLFETGRLPSYYCFATARAPGTAARRSGG